MSPALTKARQRSEPNLKPEPVETLDVAPLDLVHLSRQTLGDASLEQELLLLFDAQCDQVALRLAAPAKPGDADWRAALAHTLKGSASAVGAFEVAGRADAYEEAARLRSAPLDEDYRRLALAIARARAAIAALLSQ